MSDANGQTGRTDRPPVDRVRDDGGGREDADGRNDEGGTEVAVLGGGCFWCLEAVFQRVGGVRSVESGYAGGEMDAPTYGEVCSGRTGHAEVVRVGFDPEVISFRRLLEIFFAIHDPTTPNRQGADVGPEYRSIILPTSEEQEDTAREEIERLEREDRYDAPVVTEIEPLEVFYRAEEAHQDYYRNNPGRGYCRIVIEPKLRKLEELEGTGEGSGKSAPRARS